MRDVVTALSFDNAVMTFGIWAENKMGEQWAAPFSGPKYTLEDILRGDDEQYIRQRNQGMAEVLFAPTSKVQVFTVAA